MADADAEVAQQRGVAQVALPATHRQRRREMLQQRATHAEVAFRVLEVNRVNFMRHGARADFTGDRVLAKIIQRDITPCIAVEIDERVVKPAQRMTQRGDVVMRFDLRGQRLVTQTQTRDKIRGDDRPVDAWIRVRVRVEVAARAVDFPHDLRRIKFIACALQTRGDDREFFSHGGRAGWLTVSAREHGLRRVFACQVAQAFHQLAHLWRNHFGARAFDVERVSQVVDVLGSAGEVNELARCGKRLAPGHGFF